MRGFFISKCLLSLWDKLNEMNEEIVNEIINYIENDAEIAMPIDELVNEDGRQITKKEYGKVLLKYLVIELREKFTLQTTT